MKNEYVIPDFKTLLEDHPSQGQVKEAVQEQAKILLTHLNSYGVKAELAQINEGPVITQFEIKMEAGTKPPLVIATIPVQGCISTSRQASALESR